MGDHKEVDEAYLVALIVKRFPMLADRIAREKLHGDPIYHAMRIFTDYIQSAIDGGDFDQVQLCFRFLDDVLRRATDSVYNAINVGCIEHINFTNEPNGPKAKKLLTPRLLKEWQALEAYWKNNQRP